ncbi:MAG: flagellar basal body L-ring protein FlgH [Caulobacterales bacterium]
MNKILLCSTLAVMTAGCGSTQGMRDALYGPKLSPVSDPSRLAAAEPVAMPISVPESESAGPNSLWRNGSRAFFKDQRASKVGDILTVEISIKDSAQLQNDTARSRKGETTGGITNLFGLETPITNALPGPAVASKLLDLDGASSSSGTGSVKRAETIDLTVAAVVVQILPNGNLVIAGRQQVKVNAEMRELTISGLIRPEDISNDNKILHTQIAEARIEYGGRGDLTAVQRPRWGQRVLDVAAPY